MFFTWVQENPCIEEFLGECEFLFAGVFFICREVWREVHINEETCVSVVQ